ncbi:Pre-mRNA-splicing factor cwc26 [Nowakowskiella sp. JEL0407]|nr:Pre-mRNA-splicing factor cwc26 [Nowakowskiella sp. JEL0407]
MTKSKIFAYNMPNASMQEYLAKKYNATRSMSLSDSSKKKTKKSSKSSVKIIDEDEPLWSTSKKSSQPVFTDTDYDTGNSRKLEVDEGLPSVTMVFEDGSTGEAKFSTQNWVTVEGDQDEPEKSSPPPEKKRKFSPREEKYTRDDSPPPRARSRIQSHSPEPEKRSRIHSESPPPSSNRSKDSQSQPIPSKPGSKNRRNQPAEMVAEAIHRDKFGRKIDMEALKAEEAAKEAKKLLDEKEKLKWSQGVAQRQLQKQMEERMESERSRPLAIYEHERNETLKNRERWEDPMAKMGGTKAKSKRAECPYPGPPNRYGIKPGHKWDGVDRSNGFENKLIQQKYSKEIMKEEAYKWSTEDM